MAISKEKKERLVSDYQEKFSRSKAILGADYRGLTVVQMGGLRNELRSQGCEFLVAKNTLIKLALERAGLPVPESLLEGPTAIGVCYQDIVVPAKTLANYAKEMEQFSLKGGVLGRSRIGPEDVVTLSNLPSREVLVAQLLGGMQAPMGSLVGTLNRVIQGLANVLNARAGQLKPEAA